MYFFVVEFFGKIQDSQPVKEGSGGLGLTSYLKLIKIL